MKCRKFSGPFALLALLGASACVSTTVHDHDYLVQNGGWCDACDHGWCDGREFDRLCCYEAWVIEGSPCPEHGE